MRILVTVLFELAGCAHAPRRATGTANPAGVTAANPAGPIVTAKPAVAERLGTVHVIGTGQRFVLVQTPSAQPVAGLSDGQMLVCRAGSVVTASLRVSHERRPPFVVADVAAGEPHVGDEVFIAPTPGTLPSPAATPGTAAPDFHADPVLPPTR